MITALLRRPVTLWRDFWFAADAPPLALDVVRIGAGLGLLLIHGFLGPDLHALYGAAGWVPADAVAAEFGHRAVWSPLSHLGDTGLTVFHALLMAGALALTLGWRTRWVKWWVLFGHLAFVHRNPLITYGVDSTLSALLWILCLAPIGRALSLDARRTGRPAAPSPWGNACLRLIQLQMAVMFFFAGAGKVRGDAWWHGHAVWTALTNHEYGRIPLGWLADHFWLINLMTYGSVLLELAYPFLVWGRARAPIVAGAVALHLGIAVTMGLWAFALVMACGHLAFLRAPWIERGLARLTAPLPPRDTSIASGAPAGQTV